MANGSSLNKKQVFLYTIGNARDEVTFVSETELDYDGFVEVACMLSGEFPEIFNNSIAMTCRKGFLFEKND